MAAEQAPFAPFAPFTPRTPPHSTTPPASPARKSWAARQPTVADKRTVYMRAAPGRDVYVCGGGGGVTGRWGLGVGVGRVGRVPGTVDGDAV